MLRVLANCILVVSILFFPWWVTVSLVLVAVVIFRAFYEALVWAFVADILYGTGIAALFGASFLLTVGAVTLVVTVEGIKKMTRFY